MVVDKNLRYRASEIDGETAPDVFQIVPTESPLTMGQHDTSFSGWVSMLSLVVCCAVVSCRVHRAMLVTKSILYWQVVLEALKEM